MPTGLDIVSERLRSVPTPLGSARQSPVVGETTSPAVAVSRPRTGLDIVQANPLPRSVFDQTIGAFTYGAADTGALISRSLGSIYSGQDPFDSLADSLESFKRSNPQYAPEEVESALDLLSRPGALVSRVASGLPYIAALLGVSLASPTSAIALAGLIEGRRGYEGGLADGLDEGSATSRGIANGMIGGFLQWLPVARLLRGASGEQTAIASALMDKAFKRITASGAIGQAAKFVAAQTVINTLGGRSSDLIDLGLFGKPLPENFLDLAAQDAINGAIVNELVGTAHRELSISKGGLTPKDKAHPGFDIDTVETKDLIKEMTNAGYPEQFAKEHLAAIRGEIQFVAANEGLSIQEASARMFNQRALVDGISHTMQGIDQLGLQAEGKLLDMPDKLPREDARKTLVDIGGDEGMTWLGLHEMLNDPKKGVIDKKQMLAKIRESQALVFDKLGGLPEVKGWLEERSLYTEELAEVQKQAQKAKPEAQGGFAQAVEQITGQIKGVNEKIKGAIGDTGDQKVYQIQVAEEPKRFLVRSEEVRQGDQGEQRYLKVNGTKAEDGVSPEIVARQILIEAVHGKYDGIVSDDPAVLRDVTRGLQEGEVSYQEKAFQAGKEWLPGVKINERLRQRTIDDGFSLYQPAADLPEGKKVKAIRDETGHIYAMDVEDHAIILKEAGVPFRKVESTGLVIRHGAESTYVGDRTSMRQHDPSRPKESGYSITEPENQCVTVLSPPKTRVRLFQPNRASVTFLASAQANIKLFRSADKSSFWHEFSHVIRRWLPEGSQEVVKKWLGTSDLGDPKAEEKFASAMERWAATGNAPSGELAPLFNSFKTYLTNIYGKVKSIGMEMPPEVRFEMEKIFKADSAPGTALKMRVVEARRLEEQLKVEIEGIKKQSRDKTKTESLKNGPSEGDASKEELAAKQAELKNTQESIKAWTNEIDRLNAQTFKPGGKSEMDRMSETQNTEILSAMRPPEHWAVSKMKDVWHTVKENTVDLSARLQGNPQGDELLSKLRVRESINREQSGSWHNDFTDMYEGMTHAERSRMASDSDNTGLWGYKRVAEDVNIPEELKLQPQSQGDISWRSLARQFVQETGRLMEFLGIQRKIKGSYQPARASEETRLAQVKRPEAVAMMSSQSGEAWDARTKWILKYNPGVTQADVVAEAKAYFGDTSIHDRAFGGVDFARKIKYEPDVVYLKDGSEFVIHPPDVLEYARGLVNRTASRLSWIEVFGQNVLKDIDTKPIGKLARRLASVSKPLAEIMGLHFSEKLNKYVLKKSDATLVEELSKSGWDRKTQLEGLTRKELLELASKSEIDPTPSREDLIHAFEQFDTRRFFSKPGDKPKGTAVALRQFARDIGGVDSTASINKVWVDIVARMKETRLDEGKPYIQRLFESYKRNARGEEDVKAFVNVVSLAQGIIPPALRPSTTTLSRIANFTFGLLGRAQTSLAAIPNLPQTITQLPQLGLMVNFDKAFANVLKNPKGIEHELVAMGAFDRAVRVWTREPGRTWETVGRWVKNIIEIGTGQRAIGQFNNVVAGEVFRQLADGWRAGGINERGRQTARFLGLSDADIAGINSGQMDPRIYKRIIQEGVAKTQYITEAAYLQPKWSRIGGVAQLFMAYQSYTVGTLKANYNVLSEMYSGIKSLDEAKVFASSQRMFLLVAGLYGAGVASQIMRQAIKGDFRKERAIAAGEDTEQDRFIGAMTEASLLGPAQRMISGFDYDGGSTEKFLVGLLPQVNALAQMFNAAVGRGPFGEFAAGKRVQEAAKTITPAYKAFVEWANNVAYPEFIEYKSAREISRRFVAENSLQRSSPTDVQLNPNYYPVWFYAARGDREQTQVEMSRYMQNVVAHRQDIDKAIDGLRASLVARSPVPVARKNLMQFLQSVPAERRVDVLGAQRRYMAVVDSVVPR